MCIHIVHNTSLRKFVIIILLLAFFFKFHTSTSIIQPCPQALFLEKWEGLGCNAAAELSSGLHPPLATERSWTFISALFFTRYALNFLSQ